MYKIKVNDKHEFEVKESREGTEMNGDSLDWDIVAVEPGSFHILKDNRSYRAEVVEAKFDEKAFVIRVNGNDYTVQVKDRYDLLLEKMGMAGLAATQLNDIKAPMPGLVLDVKVKDGDTISKGDAVLILEAMKMENVLKAPADATVKAVKVKTGDAVEKNQVLVELEAGE